MVNISIQDSGCICFPGVEINEDHSHEKSRARDSKAGRGEGILFSGIKGRLSGCQSLEAGGMGKL